MKITKRERLRSEVLALNGNNKIPGLLDASPHLKCDAFGLADNVTYFWVARHELPYLDWQTVPNVGRWFDAVGARPAVRRGVDVPATTA